MSRMIWKPGRAVGALLALGALALTGAAPAAGQNVVVRPRVHVQQEDCKCVDKDGKPIERCTCFVMPDVDRITTTALAAVRGRARLGVTLASEANPRGAEVESVLEGGPADEAGIREGDVITRVDGKSLLEPLGADLERDFDEDGNLPVQRLMALVRAIEPGDDVAVEYLRDGERRTATLEARDLGAWSFSYAMPDMGHVEILRDRMGDLEGRMRELRLRAPGAPGTITLWNDSADAPRVFMRGDAPSGSFRYRLGGEDDILRACPAHAEGGWGVLAFGGCPGGLQLVELNPGLAEYFGTSTGVLVADVHEDSRTGLRPGDVVLGVGSRDAADPDRLRRILDSYGPDEEVTVRIMRQKREMSIQGTLGR